MLRIAQEKAAAARTPRPVFLQGDAAEPPLPERSFDVVLARHVLGRSRAQVHLRQLAGDPLLWGKPVDDERYLIHSPA